VDLVQELVTAHVAPAGVAVGDDELGGGDVAQQPEVAALALAGDPGDRQRHRLARACWPWKARPMQFWHDHDRVVQVPALTCATLIVLDVSQASSVPSADQVRFE